MTWKSLIRIHGPPLDKAFDVLCQLAKDLHRMTDGKLSDANIVRTAPVLGDHDFEFVWAEKPDLEMVRVLIHNIDEVMLDIGARYRIMTTEIKDLSLIHI